MWLTSPVPYQWYSPRSWWVIVPRSGVYVIGEQTDGRPHEEAPIVDIGVQSIIRQVGLDCINAAIELTTKACEGVLNLPKNFI